MVARLTTELFIERAREAHGDRYDYSQTEYVNSRTPVSIICPKHGLFQQMTRHHMCGRGCKLCDYERRQGSPDHFLEKARSVHGDRYDYSRAEYAGISTPVTIICQEHGPFSQTPKLHYSGAGCRKCAGKHDWTHDELVAEFSRVHGDHYDYDKVRFQGNLREKIIITCPVHGDYRQAAGEHLKGRRCKACVNTEKAMASVIPLDRWLADCRAVHGDKYDYSRVSYETGKDEVTIGCPDHGWFQQIAWVHKAGHGCMDCSGKRPLTPETFAQRGRERYGDRYDYSQVEPFANVNAVVTIICPEHGPFQQAVINHMHIGGCNRCGVERRVAASVLTQVQFLERAHAIHEDRYDYSLSQYRGQKHSITIICQVHGPFDQVPGTHLDGSGCPDCAVSGYKVSQPGTLYYKRIVAGDDTILYKIGITNYEDPLDRWVNRGDKNKITVIASWQYDDGAEALERETALLRQHKEYAYSGPNVLTSGNTEMFTVDVLGLDDIGE